MEAHCASQGCHALLCGHTLSPPPPPPPLMPAHSFLYQFSLSSRSFLFLACWPCLLAPSQLSWPPQLSLQYTSSFDPRIYPCAPPPLTLSMEPFNLSPTTSCLTPGDPVETSHPSFLDLAALQKLSFSLESLIHPSPDHAFSDAVIHVQGRGVPVHRCILAARCPYFQSLFSEEEAQLQSLAPEGVKELATSKLQIDLQLLINRRNSAGKAGYEAFAVVLLFIYTGRLRTPNVTCIDDQCTHAACRPVLDFTLEMLCLSSLFDIPEMTTLWQDRLINMGEKAQIDDVLPILVASEIYGNLALQSMCTQIIATSNLDFTDIKKQLPLQLAEKILVARVNLGLLQPEEMNHMHEKQCKRIQKALDSDDVELVQMLLNEGQISLDGAHALHYAAAYCDPHTMQEILDLGLADPNSRDKRGYTVLHVAAMRRDPTILVSLLTKGAHPLELTPSGQTALQLSRRLTRNIDNFSSMEAGEELQRDRICIEVLEQAGKQNPFADAPLFPAAEGKDLFMRLLYLENRVALARLLFPQEAKIVTGLAHLEATSEFTGLGNTQLSIRVNKKEAGVDLNQIPSNQAAGDGFSLSPPYMDETLVKRVQALQKTVELGKRFFPRGGPILNSLMDDDLSELTCLEKGSPEEQKAKRKCYCELRDALAVAFQKDVAAMDRQKP